MRSLPQYFFCDTGSHWGSGSSPFRHKIIRFWTSTLGRRPLPPPPPPPPLYVVPDDIANDPGYSPLTFPHSSPRKWAISQMSQPAPAQIAPVYGVPRHATCPWRELQIYVRFAVDFNRSGTGFNFEFVEDPIGAEELVNTHIQKGKRYIRVLVPVTVI
ncbi:hypothetical protein I7I51_03806 [Histoplasma capsulatum]|uniref:Uncharacterized protein n=1 Tax=Ajellomyces capsulatus TaxID=5037 RepID=A0A8A1M6I7_AJECA|nr:hypothetical protein I7I51_03806 [Histoplasma capsulatum]